MSEISVLEIFAHLGDVATSFSSAFTGLFSDDEIRINNYAMLFLK
jgi:hypothetical protein